MKKVEQGPERFYIAGELDIESELVCTGDDDVEELSEMYGPSMLAELRC